MDKYKNEQFDYSYLANLQSQEEYRQKLKQIAMANNYASLVNRKVYKP